MVQHLPDAARPGDLDFLGGGIRAGTERHTRIARRRLPRAGANSHAVTGSTGELQQDPVIAIRGGIGKDFRTGFSSVV
jgi:hypothetical protein